MLPERISLTLSRHSSLSFIASGWSSRLHPVSSQSCCMQVRAGRPAFARPCEGVYTALLLNCIEPKIDNILRKNQNAFRRNRSTSSQILTIRRILIGVQMETYRRQYYLSTLPRPLKREDGTNSTSIRPTKRDRRSHNDSLQKHQSECTFLGWRYRLLRDCSRSTARGHTSPIPLYHLSRLRAQNIDW